MIFQPIKIKIIRRNMFDWIKVDIYLLVTAVEQDQCSLEIRGGLNKGIDLSNHMEA